MLLGLKAIHLSALQRLGLLSTKRKALSFVSSLLTSIADAAADIRWSQVGSSLISIRNPCRGNYLLFLQCLCDGIHSWLRSAAG